MNKNTPRSIIAVTVGALAGLILTLGTDIVLHAARVFPPWGERVSDGPLLLATAYRTLFGVLGSYIAARLAPDRRMFHAMVLGLIGFAVSVLGAALTWKKGPAFGPHWYPLALVVLALPQAWLGGKFGGDKQIQAPA